MSADAVQSKDKFAPFIVDNVQINGLAKAVFARSCSLDVTILITRSWVCG